MTMISDVLDRNEKDHHVVMAALWARADAIVTEDRALGEEVGGLVDVQRLPEFVSYAVDVDAAAAVEVLLRMARAWVREEAVEDSEVWARLMGWMHRHDWTAATHILEGARLPPSA